MKLKRVLSFAMYAMAVLFTSCGNSSESNSIKSFSVAEDKQVVFSPGNLQLTPGEFLWRFADGQTSYIGKANTNCDVWDYDGWIDLFGWSTEGIMDNIFGVSTSTYDDDYEGSFLDWGWQMRDDAPTWRTLTYEEWKYLLYTRNNAAVLKGIGQVNGVNGLILLPDNWTCPDGVTFKSGFHSYGGENYYAAYQTFTTYQWSKLEKSGAVFLPAAGYRYGSDVKSVQGGGFYWSATEGGSSRAYFLYFYSDGAGMIDGNRSFGKSVRLVRDL